MSHTFVNTKYSQNGTLTVIAWFFLLRLSERVRELGNKRSVNNKEEKSRIYRRLLETGGHKFNFEEGGGGLRLQEQLRTL